MNVATLGSLVLLAVNIRTSYGANWGRQTGHQLDCDSALLDQVGMQTTADTTRIEGSPDRHPASLIPSL